MTVKQKQHLLAYLGYYVGNIDGVWGTLSKTATLAFQKDYGSIAADGIVGGETEEALKQAVAKGMPAKDVTIEEAIKDAAAGDWWDEVEHITRKECACKCGGRYCNGYPAEMQKDVVVVANRARKHFGAPIHIISGLRCEQHNANEGGVWNSQHMYGEALDVRIDGRTADELLAFFVTQPEIRYAYAINRTNVHIDIPKGAR